MFKKEGDQWNEYTEGKLNDHFKEQGEDLTYLYIVSARRDDDPTHFDFSVRIPRCGGVAAWTWAHPINWTDFVTLRPQS
jgi:hypothetical protein